MKIIYGWFIWGVLTLILISTELEIIPDILSETQILALVMMLIGMFLLLLSFSAGEIRHLIHPFRKVRRLHYKKRNYYSKWA